MNTATITGRIKASAALVDPNRYGRSDRSPTATAHRCACSVDLLGISLLTASRRVSLPLPTVGRATCRRQRVRTSRSSRAAHARRFRCC